jgi:tetratricopeptide (TPR) repeat protein
MNQSELSRRGLEQLKAGNYEEAKRLFREHEEKSGTAAETRSSLKQAETLLSRGDVNGSAKLFDQILDRNPTLPEVYLGLARISLATSQLDAARTHATAATKLAPETGLGWTLLGLVHEASNDLATALQHVRKGAELAPSVYLCQFNHGRVLAAAGKPAEGVGPLKRATELEPSNADGFYTLGLANKQAGQNENAIKAFEKAAALAPKSVDAWATLADVLFSLKQFKAAREALDKGLANCGDHPALLEKATATAMMLSDTAGAIAYVERELKAVPNHEQALINLANLRALNKEFDKSEQAAQELLKRNPRNWEAYFHLGNLYELSPATEMKAEEAYRKAIELNPDHWKPLANLGALLVEMKNAAKNSEAVPVLEQAQMLAPKGEYLVQHNLALAYVKLGKRERALELARKILREAPADTPIVKEAKKLESNLLEAGAR